MRLFEKFFVCPNCKEPLYRKSALKLGAVREGNYCTNCGADIASAKRAALAILKKSK